MGDDDHALVLLMRQLCENIHNALFCIAVQIAGGLIRNNDFGIMGKSTGNAHTLLLTAGQLQHLAFCSVLIDSDLGKKPKRKSLFILFRAFADVHGKHNISSAIAFSRRL